MFCTQCGKQNEEMAKFCYSCGSDLKSEVVEDVGFDGMIGYNEELNNYVVNAQGISRVALNIMCFIGVFIFGWLLAVVFGQLGKGSKGWFYVVPVIVILVVSRQGAGALRLIAMVIYIAGWIDANMVLSRYESLAKQRIAEIEGGAESGQTVNILLEQGLLKSKVLRQQEQALEYFDKAMQLPGGDPRLLNLAGLQYSAAKRYSEARFFFKRAMEMAKDENLVKQIKKNQAFAETR